MKQYFKHCLTALGCGLLSVSVHAQDLDGTPASNKSHTDARTSGDNGGSSLYTPNLFDGGVDIRIPIYDYTADNADYGIALTYNTRGVKLDEESGVVGLHFNLRAESAGITRTVRGLPDELAVSFYDTVVYNNSQKYYAARGRLAAVTETSILPAGVLRDSESDEFQMTLGGSAFTFLIGTDGQIFTNPQRGITVAVLSNGAPYWNSPPPASGTLAFLVTDEQGNRYYFKKGDISFRFLYLDALKAGTMPGNQVAEYEIIDRWVVDKVILADGREIVYQYRQATGAVHAMYKSFSFIGFPQQLEPAGSEVNGSDYRALLKSIRYPNGITANFIYDDSKSRCDVGGLATYADSSILKEINVGSDYGPCLRYKMHQVYAVADPANLNLEIPISDPCRDLNNSAYYLHQQGSMPSYQNHRLRLKSITLASCDGLQEEEPFYSFDYDGKGLPPRFRGGQDWYGYCNGQEPVWPFTGIGYNPDMTIPLHSQTNGPASAYGVNREPNLTFTKAGSLKSITNAYGGSTRFTYTAAVVGLNYSGYDPAMPGTGDSYFFNRNPAVDGLMIDSIIESDPFHPENRKHTTFRYSDGWAWFGGGYYHYPKTLADYNQGPSAPGIFTGSRLTSQQAVNGSNHGFGLVTMIARNSEGQQLFRKETTFTTVKDASNNGAYRYLVVGGGKKYYQYPFTDKQYLRDWEIGLPLTVTDFDDQDNIIQAAVNRYTFSVDSLSAITTGVAGTHIAYLDTRVPNQPTIKTPVSDPYKPYRGKSLLQSTVVRKYISNSSAIYDSIAYAYDSRYNLKKIFTWNSLGEEIQTIHYYNYDAGANDPLPGLQRLAATQRWKRPAGVAGDLPENGLLLDAFFYGLSREGTFPTFSKITNKNLYTPLSSKPRSYTQYLGTGPDNSTALKINAAYGNTALTGFRKASEVLRVDTKNNPLETYLPEPAQYKAMIWDTATGQKLAEAANCRYDEMAYAGFEANGYSNFQYNPSGVSGNSEIGGRNVYFLKDAATISRSGLTAGKKYLVSFWATHAPACMIGGVQVTLSPGPTVKGIWTYYQGSFTPAGSSDVFVLSRTVNLFIDEVRLHPASAQMQTWNADPLLGITSASDGQGRITYYEYDGMGRPYLVRDMEGHILSKTQYTLRGAE